MTTNIYGQNVLDTLDELSNECPDVSFGQLFENGIKLDDSMKICLAEYMGDIQEGEILFGYQVYAMGIETTITPYDMLMAAPDFDK